MRTLERLNKILNHLAVFRKVKKVNLKSLKKAQNHHTLNHTLNLVNPVILVLHTNQTRKIQKVHILLYYKAEKQQIMPNL